MIVITVHDEVADTWSNPVCVANGESAKRDFRSACADERSLIGQHPSDFKLYAVGEWFPSEEPGKLPRLNAFDAPVFLLQGENHDKA